MDKLGMALDSIARMTNRFEETNEKYKEILVLEKMLTDSGIPYTKQPMFGGWHICYPNEENTVCSVIEHNGSHGREVDKIEIMGLLTDEESKYDSVLGGLSAQEVFERIKKHYESGGQQ